MQSGEFRALVVDDEDALRNLVARALLGEGFHCDQAADGMEALGRVAGHRYDVVITDLRMPNRHGHALAVELLALDDRPAVVVYTAVLEPRLAKDLMLRGVDDIVFKPVDLALFAAKVKGLVSRRRQCSENSVAVAAVPAQVPALDEPDEHEAPAESDATSVDPRTESPWAGSPQNTPRMPLSVQTALDVYHMTCRDECEPEEIAAAIIDDAVLTAELLRIGNSSEHNPAGRKIVDIEEVVRRIGRRRVGELVLIASVLAGCPAGTCTVA